MFFPHHKCADKIKYWVAFIYLQTDGTDVSVWIQFHLERLSVSSNQNILCQNPQSKQFKFWWNVIKQYQTLDLEIWVWTWCFSSPVLQVQVHGRVQADVGHVQELRVEDARPGWRQAVVEGGGGAGRSQIQPFHRLPWRLGEGHSKAVTLGGDRWDLSGHWRYGRVHHVAAVESIARLLQASVLGGHLQERRVSLRPAHGAQQRLQTSVSVSHRVIVREHGGRHVTVVSVELGRNCKVRHNFGYRRPLFFGVSWNFFKTRQWHHKQWL